MITRHSAIDLLFVIAPHSLLLDIAGPAEAFRLANLHRAARRLPPRFRLRFAGPSAKAPTSVGPRALPTSNPCRNFEHADLGGSGRPTERAPGQGDAGDRRHCAVAEPYAA